MKRALGSILIWLFYTFMFVFMLLAIVLAYVISFPFDRFHKLTNWIFLTLGRNFVRFNPYWNLKMSGFEKWSGDKPVLLVSNHQSFMDMPLQTMLPCKMKWISKKSLFKIPIMGWSMKLCGHISIDRKKRTSIKSLEHQMMPVMEQNIPIMIFPEGTRSETGQLRTFKNGAFDLAIKHKWLIQPVVIDGTYKLLPSGDWRFHLKENIFLSLLDPIDPVRFDSRDEMKSYTFSVMKKELERLRDKRSLAEPV